MTKPQRITLMAEWWPNACAAQGWDVKDRERRLEVLSEAVGRELESANDLDSRGDVDKVKSHLGMLADSVQGAIEVDHPEEGQGRRLRVGLRDLVKCIGVYHPAPEAYLRKIIEGICNKGSRFDLPGIDGLSASGHPSQLHQVLTATARAVHGKRRQAGDSVHGMKTRAGVQCNCALCVSQAIAAVPAENIPW